MPTPSGKLKAGDRLRWTSRNPSGSMERLGETTIDFVVVERTSNDVGYAVWIKRVDDKPIGRFSDHTRNNGTEAMLLDAHYQIKHGPFRVVEVKTRLPRISTFDSDAYWKQLRTWALREKELNEGSAVPNQAQLQTLNALLHRMSRAEAGDPEAFRTI